MSALCTALLWVPALSIALGQTEIDSRLVPVFDAHTVDASIQALRVPLDSLRRPSVAAAGAPDLGSAIDQPAPVTMLASTVDTLPRATPATIRTPLVNSAVACTVVVDVDIHGSPSAAHVAYCDRSSVSLEAMVARAVLEWEFRPAMLAGHPTAVAGVPLTVQVKPLGGRSVGATAPR